MRAFIYSGGSIDKNNIDERPAKDDLIIAADQGYGNAKALGVKPSILLGDFDSLERSSFDEDGVEIMTVPAEKDFTDTQMAVDVAVKRGATELVIIGGLGGRLDHTLSNLAILEDMHSKGIRVTINDGYNRVRYIKNDGIIILRSKYKYISLLAKGDKVKGVSIEGCKYPLNNATLTERYQYAVSNEIVGNCTLINVKKGALLIVESRDKT